MAPAGELRQNYRTLVVMQPTAFCNIDCSYCYLPGRDAGARMSPQVRQAAFDRVLGSALVQDPVVFLWHLGEPLSVPPAFYEAAFAEAGQAARHYGRPVRHGFQTNATLLSPQWARLIQRHDVSLGVSLDGPAFIHDRVRVTRPGGGTHARVMRGVALLQDAGIGFGVISVLTDFTLDYPEEYYDFFAGHGIADVGFNIDETEGAHRVSTFAPQEALDRYERFLERLLARSDAHRGAVKIREAWTNLAALAFGGPDPVNTTNQPFRIVNIDRLGNITTFCPELVTARALDGTGFVMGNVLTGSLDDVAADPVFRRVSAEVAAGVARCRDTCAYWSFCGGGSPSNKYFEHGSFSVAQTRACRVHKQATVDVLLRHLRQRTARAGAPGPPHQAGR